MENLSIPFKVEVRTFDDYFSGPELATVTINEETYKRILRIAKVVKQEKLSYAAEYDDSPEFFVLDENDEPKEPDDFSIDCCMLHITSGHFYWRFSIKHTTIDGETDAIYIKHLKECYKAATADIKTLPPMLGDCSDYAEPIILKRLGENS
jgi:hypothetical protein